MILKDPLSQLNAPEPILLSEEDTVSEALRLMAGTSDTAVCSSSMAVASSSAFSPSVTLCVAVKVGEVDLDEVPLGTVMTKEPTRLNETDTLAVALNRMSVGEYRHVPIVRDGKPVGFCSIRGILRYLADNALT